MLAGLADQVGVDVHADDGARRTHDVPHQRGVVAGTRADLEDPLARCEGQLIQHDRHDGGLRRGADRLAVGVPLGHDRVVEVSVLRRQVRQEQVPRHVAQRRGDPLVADPAGLQDLGDKALPQPGQRRALGHGPSSLGRSRVRHRTAATTRAARQANPVSTALFPASSCRPCQWNSWYQGLLPVAK